MRINSKYEVVLQNFTFKQKIIWVWRILRGYKTIVTMNVKRVEK